MSGSLLWSIIHRSQVGFHTWSCLSHQGSWFFCHFISTLSHLPMDFLWWYLSVEPRLIYHASVWALLYRSSCLGGYYEEFRVTPPCGRVFLIWCVLRGSQFPHCNMRSFSSKEFILLLWPLGSWWSDTSPTYR
jgi:hypothetical protein